MLNSRLALYPCRVARGIMGVFPSSVHVFCGLGESLRPVLQEYGVPGPRLMMWLWLKWVFSIGYLGSTLEIGCCSFTSKGASWGLIRMLLGAFPWRFSGHVQLIGDPGVDPEHAGEIIYLIWPGNASGSPRRSWKMLLGRGASGLPCLVCCHCDPAPDKQKKMDGWMDGWTGMRVVIDLLIKLSARQQIIIFFSQNVELLFKSGNKWQVWLFWQNEKQVFRSRVMWVEGAGNVERWEGKIPLKWLLLI